MKGMTQIVEILSALFFEIIIVQIIVKYDIMRSKLELNKIAARWPAKAVV